MQRSREAMRSKRESTLRRIAIVGAIGALALIGDMRASGSQGVPGQRTVEASRSPHAVAAGRAALGDGAEARSAGRNGADTSDDAQLVPAIYAWDPDVRFVYYRHVSKWM